MATLRLFGAPKKEKKKEKRKKKEKERKKKEKRKKEKRKKEEEKEKKKEERIIFFSQKFQSMKKASLNLKMKKSGQKIPKPLQMWVFSL